MTTAVLKKEIQKIIEHMDDKNLLEAVHTILNKNLSRNDYELSDEDIRIIEERKASYKSGKSKMYTLEEINKKLIKNLKK